MAQRRARARWLGKQTEIKLLAAATEATWTAIIYFIKGKYLLFFSLYAYHTSHTYHTYIKMSTKKKKNQKQFTKDLENLLYAHGDVETPLPDTVNCLEDIMLTYITDLCHSASLYSRTTRRAKIKVDDFKFVLRNDPIKFNRIGELLVMNKEISDAKRQFDDKEGKNFDKISSNMDDDGDDFDENSTTGGGSGANGSKKDGNGNTNGGTTDGKKSAKKDENRPKRKYTKTGKERKPYKKRAKKSDLLASSSVPPSSSSAT